MALFHSGEDSVPIALDVGTARVKVCLEPSRREDTLTHCDPLGNRDSDADRNDAQICDDFRSPIVIANNTRDRMIRDFGQLDCSKSPGPVKRIYVRRFPTVIGLGKPQSANGVSQAQSSMRWLRRLDEVELFDKMSLAGGSRLGSYEILAKIGAGGMSDVYKTRDRG